MPRRDQQTEEPGARRPSHARILARFDSFDVVTERAAISVLKLAGWITTIAVVLYDLWKSL
jgi:hypothetical protein